MSEFIKTLNCRYNAYKEAVLHETRELRVVLEGLEAKKQERVWRKHQIAGDLDENKLIEGLTGERNIYKTRAEETPEPGTKTPARRPPRKLPDSSSCFFRDVYKAGELPREQVEGSGSRALARSVRISRSDSSLKLP